MITLNVAGWRVRLACEPQVLAEAAAHYAAFLSNDSAAVDLTLSVQFGGSAGAATRRVSRPAARSAPLKHDLLFDADALCAAIMMHRQEALLTISRADPQEALEYLLRVVYALLAFREGGLLVHGAALAIGGGVCLFIGQSGSGKSTVVSLSPEAEALGDDLILLRPEEGGWRAHGTPFWNQAATNRSGQTRSGRLAWIYKLVKDRDVRVTAMPPAPAVAELVANCPVVNGNSVLLDELLARCRQIVETVPVSRLHFRRDRDFWPAIAGGWASGGAGRGERRGTD